MAHVRRAMKKPDCVLLSYEKSFALKVFSFKVLKSITVPASASALSSSNEKYSHLFCLTKYNSNIFSVINPFHKINGCIQLYYHLFKNYTSLYGIRKQNQPVV